MRVVVLALALVTFSASAAAQDVRPTEATGPLVLVIDSGRARVNPERLLRTVGGTLGRAVVRITDPGAASASGTLTLAHASRGRWLVRFDTAGGSASELAEITRPGLYDVALAQAARRVIAALEAGGAAPSPATASAPSRVPAGDYVAWVDDILDPFANLPPSPRRELAIASEVIDPFTPASPRRAILSEVLDPWGR